MNPSLLTTVEIEPKTVARSSVIWMHGLGADARDFEPIVPELRLPDELGIRFVFPNAPIRPVTVNGGMRMRAWYDVLSMDLPRQEDPEGVYASERAPLRLTRTRETTRHSRRPDRAGRLFPRWGDGAAHGTTLPRPLGRDFGFILLSSLDQQVL